LSGLRRVAQDRFFIENAITIEKVEASTLSVRQAYLLSPDHLLMGVPQIILDADSTRAFCFGKMVKIESTPSGKLRIYGALGQFLGVGETIEDGYIRPLRLMQTVPPNTFD